MIDELLKTVLETICGTTGHLFLRLFKRKNEQIDWIDEIVGLVLIVAIIFGVGLMIIKFG